MKYEQGASYHVGDDGIARKVQSRRSNKGIVVEGVVLKYFHVFQDIGEYKAVAPGAFEISIRDRPVELWIEHDESLRLTGCKVELFSDDESLYFRCHLDDSELAKHARDLIQVGLYTEMSAGFHSSTT